MRVQVGRSDVKAAVEVALTGWMLLSPAVYYKQYEVDRLGFCWFSSSLPGIYCLLALSFDLFQSPDNSHGLFPVVPRQELKSDRL